MFDKICSYKNLSFCVLCLLMNILSTFSQASLPSPSPAGGNYLTLDGKDDYAILISKLLFKEGTDEYTVEAWIYPTSPPDMNAEGTILRQQLNFFTINYNNPNYQSVKEQVKWGKDELLLVMYARVHGGGGGASTGYYPIILSLNKWHHIGFQANHGQIVFFWDNSINSADNWLTLIEHDTKEIYPQDFVLGGYGERVNTGREILDSFAGYIDEVRISKVARYDPRNAYSAPKGKFDSDDDTVALWHFDERNRATTFRDSSHNKYNLIGKNDAITKGPLAVDTNGKLTTSWASIKIERE